MKGPKIFQNIKYIKHSRANKIPEIISTFIKRWEAAMLPNNQSNQSNMEQNIDRNVKESIWILIEEFYSIFQHVSLEFYLIYVYT